MPARFSPASERNKEPIEKVLAPWLPPAGTVVEVASGTGQHTAHLAAAFPHLRWQPTDRTDADFDSIEAWCDGLINVARPRVLDVTLRPDPDLKADFVFNANMIHISPWATVSGLFAWARSMLSVGGHLALYGPFIEPGVETAASNLAFDISLRQRDPAWGIRNLDDVDAEAVCCGFVRRERVPMPANNLMLFYLKASELG